MVVVIVNKKEPAPPPKEHLALGHNNWIQWEEYL